MIYLGMILLKVLKVRNIYFENFYFLLSKKVSKNIDFSQFINSWNYIFYRILAYSGSSRCQLSWNWQEAKRTLLQVLWNCLWQNYEKYEWDLMSSQICQNYQNDLKFSHIVLFNFITFSPFLLQILNSRWDCELHW